MAKVLVVEDNNDNLRLITKVLEHGGYEVSSADNGLDGVSMAGKERFEFIIMDINLPEIDGLEATRRIRASGMNRDVPVIAITSYAMRGDMDRIMAAGCTAYFEKPIDPLTILDNILRVIGEKK